MSANDEPWFVPDLTMHPIAARRCVVRSPLTGAAMELSSGEYAVLSACQGWRPLQEHEAHAAAQLSAPREHRAAIRELLERCARQHLLVSVSDLVSGLGRAPAAGAATFGGVVVRTADRPRLLARLLMSAAGLGARFGQTRRWIVIDDSRDPANERANRAAIEEARSIEVTHYDRAAAAALEDGLRAEFPGAAREIAWLLGAGGAGESTPGRPLNHALLHLAGRAFVSVDDDVVLEPLRPPLAEPGFAVSDAPDETTWYESEEALLAQCSPADVDPIAEHASWLGLSMADAWVRAEKQHGALAAITLPTKHAARFTLDAHILFTHSHACGDPGSTVLPLQLLALPPRSRQWLAANQDAVAHAFGLRIGWRGQTRLRLTPRRSLTLTTLAGIDNSRLLPPTARAYRSQDLLLGIVAQWMYRSGWQVDLPLGVLHLREPAKRWLSPQDRVAPEPLPFLLAYLEQRESAIVGADPEQRLAAAGALLLDLAAASDATLSELLLEHVEETAGSVLFSIHEQLDDATLPGAWKTRLAAWLESPAFALDDASLRARAPAPDAMRKLLDAFGRSLLAWPQLWQFCRERNR
jgi:hypothetical protein